MALVKYLKSTTEGKVWNTYATNRNGVVQGIAVEGELCPRGMFSTMLFQDRNVRVSTSAKRLTVKAEHAALEAVKAHLVAQGMSNGEAV